MKANEIPLHQFLSQNATRFLIPVYQRNYDWKQKQCAQLLTDIFSNARDKEAKPYFIGSIVYTSKSLTTSRDLVIIDGQQRITTVNLLLLTIAKVFEKHGYEVFNEIWDYYLRNKYLNEGSKLKLKPIQKDEKAYYSIVNGDIDQVEVGNRILENYEYYLDTISTLEAAKLAYEGFKRLTIVEIGLDERDDAQKIFQSLNSTGLDLSQADLIRNYILMNLSPNDQETIYHKYWVPIETNTYADGAYSSKLSEYFRDFLTFKYKKVPSFRAIFEEFKQKFTFETDSTSGLENGLEQMKNYSKHYLKFLNPNKETDTDIKKELKRIEQLEMTVAYPYLLGVFEDYSQSKIDKTELLSILVLLQTFIFRRFICNLPTNALNKIFATLYDNVQKLRRKYPRLSLYDSTATVLVRYTSYQKFPTDADISENLKIKDIYKSQSKNKNYLFEMLENNYSGFNEMEIDIEQSSKSSRPITIEHIFPQNPNQEWKKTLSSDEFAEMQSLADTLANLTIVINNSSLGNKSFIDKRDLNKEDSKGFKYSKFHLNELLSDLQEWNLHELNKRYEVLLNKFLNIWKYPIVDEEILKARDAELEIDISELDDVTNKKPEYVVFAGVKTKVDSFRDILKLVVSEFMNSEPETLWIPEIKDKLNLSQNEDNVRNPLKIDDKYVVEGNISANHIIRNIVSILNKSDDLNDLLIKFQDNYTNGAVGNNSTPEQSDSIANSGKALTNTREKQLRFWTEFKSYALKLDPDLKLQSPRPQVYYDISMGSADAHVALIANSLNKTLCCEIYISRNRNLFDYLYVNKSSIEHEVGSTLEWHKATKASMIKIVREAPKLFDSVYDNEYFDWFYKQAMVFKKVFGKYISEYKS